MTQTIPTSIERDILIDAPIETVWRTVTDADLIPLWFSDTAEVDARPGGHGTLVFTDQATAKQVTAPIVVQVVEAPTSFAFRWGHGEGIEPTAANSMLVEFTLQIEGDRTRLRVVETGHTGMDWPDDKKATYAADHAHGWEFHLGRLQDHLGSR